MNFDQSFLIFIGLLQGILTVVALYCAIYMYRDVTSTTDCYSSSQSWPCPVIEVEEDFPYADVAMAVDNIWASEEELPINWGEPTGNPGNKQQIVRCEHCGAILSVDGKLTNTAKIASSSTTWDEWTVIGVTEYACLQCGHITKVVKLNVNGNRWLTTN